MMKLAEIFARIAADTSFQVDKPDGNGFWHLSLDGVHVAFAEFTDGKWVYAWARVGACPEGHRREILERLLAYGHPSRIAEAKAGSFSMNDGDIFFQQLLPGWKLDLELVLLSLREVADVTKRMREALYDYPLEKHLSDLAEPSSGPSTEPPSEPRPEADSDIRPGDPTVGGMMWFN